MQKLPILPLSHCSQAVSAVTFYLRNLWLILTLMAFAAYEDEGVHFFQNEAPNVTVIHAQRKNRHTRKNNVLYTKACITIVQIIMSRK